MSRSRSRSRIRSIDMIAAGVHFVEGPASNWVVLTGDGSATLIDAGYPADIDLVEQSLHEVAGPVPLRAVAITHGHSDHIGGVNELVRRHPGAVVLAATAEIPNIRREVLEQVGLRDLVPHLWRPRVVSWAFRAVWAGGLADVGVHRVEAVPTDRSIDLSGHEVRAFAASGHTSGHTCFRLVGENVIVTGDALVTGHPTSPRRGPQPLPGLFHHDRAHAAEAFEWLSATDAVALLPGHGPVHRR